MQCIVVQGLAHVTLALRYRCVLEQRHPACTVFAVAAAGVLMAFAALLAIIACQNAAAIAAATRCCRCMLLLHLLVIIHAAVHATCCYDSADTTCTARAACRRFLLPCAVPAAC